MKTIKMFDKALKQAKIEDIKSDALDVIYNKKISIHLIKMIYKEKLSIGYYNLMAKINNYPTITKKEFQTLIKMVEVYENAKQ